MGVEVKVPALGESITEATLGEWLKQPGDAVADIAGLGRGRDRGRRSAAPLRCLDPPPGRGG